MEPTNSNVKISMKMLNANEASADRTPEAPPPIDTEKRIRIKRVVNNLPYSCIVEVFPIEGIDWIYYAALDSKNNRLFYQSEYPNTILPGFSKDRLNTDEKEFMLVLWPVKDKVIGTPTYYGPVPIHDAFYLGAYNLEVEFEKPADKKLFKQVKPLIEKHYGKAALPGILHIEEDNHDVYLPSTNTIKLSPDRHNIIHELLHASRKQVLFANKKFKFDEETEMIEEFFSEGASNMIKDELNRSKNDYLQEGAVYGSTIGYNYDFRITDPSLVTQNLQSTWGGILTLEHSRYYLASEAFHKIAIEYFIKTGKYFAKEFNRIYYDYVQRELKDPDKELFFSICEQLMPTIEARPTRQWLIQQQLFNAEIIPGEKIFMDLEDYYTSDEWLGITLINLYNTFGNGSDWAEGQKRYDMNGQSIKIELTHLATNQVEYSGVHKMPDYPNGYGSVKLFFHHKENSKGVKHFMDQDITRNIKSEAIHVKSGLYRIDIVSSGAKRSYFRLMGECMWEGRDKIMVANPFFGTGNNSMQLIHYNRDRRRTLVPAQEFDNNVYAFETPDLIKNKNCEPGILQIQVNSGGILQNYQRNIGYGCAHGGHQILIGAEPKTFLPPDPILTA